MPRSWPKYFFISTGAHSTVQQLTKHQEREPIDQINIMCCIQRCNCTNALFCMLQKVEELHQCIALYATNSAATTPMYCSVCCRRRCCNCINLLFVCWWLSMCWELSPETADEGECAWVGGLGGQVMSREVYHLTGWRMNSWCAQPPSDEEIDSYLVIK